MASDTTRDVLALIKRAALSQSERLQLSGMALESVPNELFELTNLTRLDLRNNRLTSVPGSLGGLTNLTRLDLQGNQLTSVPESLGGLTNLKELDLQGNQLTSLPESLGELANLTQLELQRNQLTSVPESLGGLANLTRLNLNSNQLTSVPESLGELANLKQLYLFINQLTSVPESLRRLTSLRRLSLRDNQLTSVPEWLEELTNLVELYLYGNQLTSVPESLGGLTNLTGLYLQSNQLTSVPESLGRLANLVELNLNSNQLTSVPESLGGLTNLKQLYLNSNQLMSVPESLGGLTNLKQLYLGSNQLTSVPESLGGLANLTRLNLQSNQLTSVPESLGGLANLEELGLHGNDALVIPDEVIGPSIDEIRKGAEPANPKDILAYYFESLAGRKPLHEARLILVGYGDVGKTSIVHRLVHNKFKRQQKTEGINITKWPIQLGEDEIQLNIWDFGGQEIMHSTHQFFLTHRSLYLLVLSGRAGHEDADAEYWLQTIKSFGGNSPVIVVLNKIKEHAFDLNRGQLRQKYPFIKGFIETDCKDGTGFDALRPMIEQETDNLPHLRDMFPTSWFEIKDKLSNMEDNFISFEKYREICNRLGETSKNTQEALARYLHNLGIALNYRDDPRLRDTHVLSPRWVTQGIYAIINAKQLASQEGELKMDDLKHILDRKQYPEEKYAFLFDLMRKIELCFNFHDGSERFLIPELLGKDQPEEAEFFDPATCLNFEYHYPIVPEGLLPRFIVRTHILSQQKPRWKTGVILTFEGNEALVTADKEEKKVVVRVRGPEEGGRRRLLAIIRADFDRIHSNYKFDPVESVPVPGYPNQNIPYNDLVVREKKGRQTHELVIDDELVELNISELLSGVDLEKVGDRDERTDQGVRLFYSYSHKDEAFREELEAHLKILHRHNLIAPWHDRKILPGDRWGNEIDQSLESADVILLLISSDFIASDYCYDTEMTRAMERHEAGEAKVVPIMIRKADFSGTPFSRLQALPKDAKAVDLWPNRDEAWFDVEQGIKRVVESLKS